MNKIKQTTRLNKRGERICMSYVLTFISGVIVGVVSIVIVAVAKVSGQCDDLRDNQANDLDKHQINDKV